jgi:hypothetical protein
MPCVRSTCWGDRNRPQLPPDDDVFNSYRDACQHTALVSRFS